MGILQQSCFYYFIQVLHKSLFLNIHSYSLKTKVKVALQWIIWYSRPILFLHKTWYNTESNEVELVLYSTIHTVIDFHNHLLWNHFDKILV